jgi:hypothetical protein
MGTPNEVRAAAGANVRTMDEAFIAIVEQGRARARTEVAA